MEREAGCAWERSVMSPDALHWLSAKISERLSTQGTTFSAASLSETWKLIDVSPFIFIGEA